LLRKGTSQCSNIEFLKEAKAMACFNHANIVQFLGICLDNDPNFIIQELMEGGDLLNYLKNNRSTLTLGDLVDICHDVAKGCAYLETKHYVHRDLAARNCLLTSQDPVTRVVKIGDFGLARDIYKNDYYRIGSNGGLMPVRWMSPESLIDRVFSVQSDIWAFGVLLWEILTMGQQPYPARTHQEVLDFVRSGGHLDVPALCPSPLGDLLLKCWSYIPSDRPSFSTCLEVIRELLVFKEELNSVSCYRYDPSVSYQNGNSRDTWKTLGLLSSTSRSQATTIPMPVSPSAMSLPLPPGLPFHYVWPSNPCHDVDDACSSRSSAPAMSSSQNYLRLLPRTSNHSAESRVSSLMQQRNDPGYVTPRPGSVNTCGCQSGTPYQNMTDHVCPSTTPTTTSSAA
jgi:serine/threonine protein kinase